MAAPFPEVDTLLLQYETEPAHAFHVAALALQLFDLLAFWHQLSPRDRSLLHAAALLHDIGWSQTSDGKGHHKESLRLIDRSEWNSISPLEKNIIAQCARYHRRSIPQRDHERFSALSLADQLRLAKMTAFLRIGDALDRSHRQLIRSIEVQFFENEWKFFLKGEESSSLHAEIAMAENKSDLLEQLSGRTLVFKK